MRVLFFLSFEKFLRTYSHKYSIHKMKKILRAIAYVCMNVFLYVRFPDAKMFTNLREIWQKSFSKFIQLVFQKYFQHKIPIRDQYLKNNFFSFAMFNIIESTTQSFVIIFLCVPSSLVTCCIHIS